MFELNRVKTNYVSNSELVRIPLLPEVVIVLYIFRTPDKSSLLYQIEHQLVWINNSLLYNYRLLENYNN